MAKRRKNPNPVTAKTPDDWWEVQYMDVALHLSKAGNQSIRIDYTLKDKEREFPVSVYFTPEHPNEFARKRWRKFKKEMADHGCEIKGKTLETIVELSNDWTIQPERIGVSVSDSDDGEYENIEVVGYDWGDNPDKDKTADEIADTIEEEAEQDDLPF